MAPFSLLLYLQESLNSLFGAKMGNYSGNTLRPKKVFYTDDGGKAAGQDSDLELAGPGAATGVVYGPNGISNGTAYYLSSNSGNTARQPQDLGKAKAYPAKQKAQLDTSEWGLTREAALQRLDPSNSLL